MSKPPTSVRSIRLTDEAWAAVSEEAVRRETSVNALVSRAVLKEIGLWSDEEIAAMKAKPAPPLEINRIERMTMPRATPGSRLKKPKGSKP